MREYFEDVFSALPTKKERLEKLSELLEYPEIQADKKYYLSLLNEYNDLTSQIKVMDDIVAAVDEYERLQSTPANSDEERELFIKESDALYDKAFALRAGFISDKDTETVDYIVESDAVASRYVTDFLNLLSPCLTFDDKESSIGDGTAFSVTGRGAAAVSTVISGRHKVITPDKKVGSFTVTAVMALPMPVFKDDEFRFTLFHSSGAGGQNINKVETAVRVTHIPTGTVVTCQDERSQLRNKQRALENIKKKLTADVIADRKNKDRDVRIRQRKKDSFSIDLNDMTINTDRGVYPYPADKKAVRNLLNTLLGEVK